MSRLKPEEHISSLDNKPKYRIWAHTPAEVTLSDDPRTLNYKTALLSRLEPKFTIEKGYLTKVEYFADLDDPQSLVLLVECEYNKESRYRETTRRWALEDGSLGEHVKKGRKRYTEKQWARVQSRRRTNIIQELTAKAQVLGKLAEAQAMFLSLGNEMNAFQSTGDQTIVQKISEYPESWIDEIIEGTPYTIRQIILSEISI